MFSWIVYICSLIWTFIVQTLLQPLHYNLFGSHSLGRVGVIFPLENFSFIWRRHNCRAANFDLCSALMAMKQWGFFNVPHLLWQGPTLYNGHLRGPVTLTPVAKRLAVELLLPGFSTQVCRDRGSNPDLLHARRMLYLYALSRIYDPLHFWLKAGTMVENLYLYVLCNAKYVPIFDFSI